jgi:hypothetical protein
MAALVCRSDLRNRSEPKACLASLSRRLEVLLCRLTDQKQQTDLDREEDQEVPVGLHRLMPARFSTAAGTLTCRQALRVSPLRSE